MSAAHQGQMDPTEQYDLLHGVGIEILDSAPSYWHSITFRTSHVAGFSASHMLIERENGETERTGPPHSVIPKFGKLRSGMYQEGKGTWFSMTYTIVRPGKFTTEFDYDTEPAFTLPPSASSYAEDLERFPRDPENIPDWLRQKLREAETEQD